MEQLLYLGWKITNSRVTRPGKIQWRTMVPAFLQLVKADLGVSVDRRVAGFLFACTKFPEFVSELAKPVALGIVINKIEVIFSGLEMPSEISIEDKSQQTIA